MKTGKAAVAALMQSKDTKELRLPAPENTGTEKINYNPVILGIQENDAVRRQVAVSQKAKSA